MALAEGVVIAEFHAEFHIVTAIRALGPSDRRQSRSRAHQA
jgi:hypothetical protein